MNGKPGQRIVVESESVGTPDREGEILEVIQGEVGIRYRVRWADGHESVFTPSGGAAKIFPAAKPPATEASTAKRSAAEASTAKRSAPTRTTAKRTSASRKRTKGGTKKTGGTKSKKK
jgi:hypothetical protein